MSTAIRIDTGLDRGLLWHRGSPLAEQRRIVEGKGAVSLSAPEGTSGVFCIEGQERLTWLNALCTQNLLADPFDPEAFICDANGHILFSLLIADDGICTWCWTSPSRRDELISWLESMKFWTPVTIRARDDKSLWLCGDRVDIDSTIEIPARWMDSCRYVVCDRGCEPDEQFHCGMWAYEALRIEAGYIRADLDCDSKTIPNEIGLVGTSLDKGCYPGQETVARIYNLGRPPRRLIRALFDGDLPSSGSEIRHNDSLVGVLSSSAQHYELGPIGLALIKRSVPLDAVLDVNGIATAQEALVDPDVGKHFRWRPTS